MEVESFPRGEMTLQFEKTSILPKSLNEGLWFTSAKRLFVIEDFMSASLIIAAVHVEGDVMLYSDFSQVQGMLSVAVGVVLSSAETRMGDLNNTVP